MPCHCCSAASALPKGSRLTSGLLPRHRGRAGQPQPGEQGRAQAQGGADQAGGGGAAAGRLPARQERARVQRRQPLRRQAGRRQAAVCPHLSGVPVHVLSLARMGNGVPPVRCCRGWPEAPGCAVAGRWLPCRWQPQGQQDCEASAACLGPSLQSSLVASVRGEVHAACMCSSQRSGRWCASLVSQV